MTEQTATVDPVAEAGEKMEQICSCAKATMQEMKTKVAQAIPAASKKVSKGTYCSSYYVGYGVATAFLFLGACVPRNNAFVNGLCDGATAARDSMKSRQEKKAADSANAGKAAE